MDDYFPILTEPDWKLRDSCVWRPLVPGDQAPGVALARVVDNKLKFLTRTSAEKQGLDPVAAEATAIGHLQARADKPDWQEVQVAVADQQHSVLWRSGDHWTASDLLDQTEMAAVQLHFGTPQICLAVPHRKLLLAAAEPAALAAYQTQVLANEEAAAEKVLATRPFVADQGRLLGFFEAAKPKPSGPRVVKPGTLKRGKTATGSVRFGAKAGAAAPISGAVPIATAGVPSRVGEGKLRLVMVFLWFSTALYTLLTLVALGLAMVGMGSEAKNAEFYQFMGIFMGFFMLIVSGLHWRAMLGLMKRRRKGLGLARRLVAIWIFTPILPLAYFLYKCAQHPEVDALFPES
jgi:hypothetical protein